MGAAEPLIGMLMQGIFFLFTIIFIFFSLILAYHWFTYGSDRKTPSLALAVYLLVSAPFFLAMSISLVSF